MIEEDKLLKMIVCSHHSASQDTLRNCTKCRGLLIMRALRALSRTESEEASSRSYCAQLTIYRPLSADRMVDGARVFLLRTTMRGDYSKVQKGRTDHCTAVSALTSEPPAHAPHSNLASSNPKNRPEDTVRWLSVAQYKGLRSS